MRKREWSRWSMTQARVPGEDHVGGPFDRDPGRRSCSSTVRHAEHSGALIVGHPDGPAPDPDVVRGRAHRAGIRLVTRAVWGVQAVERRAGIESPYGAEADGDGGHRRVESHSSRSSARAADRSAGAAPVPCRPPTRCYRSPPGSSSASTPPAAAHARKACARGMLPVVGDHAGGPRARRACARRRPVAWQRARKGRPPSAADGSEAQRCRNDDHCDPHSGLLFPSSMYRRIRTSLATNPQQRPAYDPDVSDPEQHEAVLLQELYSTGLLVGLLVDEELEAAGVSPQLFSFLGWVSTFAAGHPWGARSRDRLAADDDPRLRPPPCRAWRCAQGRQSCRWTLVSPRAHAEGQEARPPRLAGRPRSIPAPRAAARAAGWRAPGVRTGASKGVEAGDCRRRRPFSEPGKLSGPIGLDRDVGPAHEGPSGPRGSSFWRATRVPRSRAAGTAPRAV